MRVLCLTIHANDCITNCSNFEGMKMFHVHLIRCERYVPLKALKAFKPLTKRYCRQLNDLAE